MKAAKFLLIVIGLSLSRVLMAQEGLISFAMKLGSKLDSMSVKGVDRRYIDAPARPWQFIVKGNVSQTIVSMKNDGTAAGEYYDARTQLRTVPSQHIGLWAGYRGYGIGYTVNVGGDKGSLLTFGATGGAFGLNVRIHTFENSRPTVNIESDLISEKQAEEIANAVLIDPIRVKTVTADGYYMFNGKKFSYAAAYDQSVIQKRSAGSLMAGLMYNYTHINYATDSNCDLVYIMEGLGRVKLWQGSAGAGYAYNWVPVKGLLVNVMAMPMLTFVNKLKAYGYTTNLEEVMADPTFWRTDISDEDWDKWYYENVRITPAGEQTFNSGLSIGFDARASLTYNFGRYFFNAYGQFNNIRYHHNSATGYVNDWFVNTAIGIRL